MSGFYVQTAHRCECFPKLSIEKYWVINEQVKENYQFRSDDGVFKQAKQRRHNHLTIWIDQKVFHSVTHS